MNTGNHSSYWYGDHADMTRALLRMGGDDAHAVWILSNAFDVLEAETDIDVPDFRAHCAAVDESQARQLDFIIGCLPTYIGEWARAGEGEEASWEREILAALHTLRTGGLACSTCLGYATRVDQVHTREAGWIDCPSHREASLQEMFTRPTLKVVA